MVLYFCTKLSSHTQKQKIKAMLANIINVLVWGCLMAALVSCNIYSPFDGGSSDRDFVELAQKCEHEGDYQCAIDKYNQMGDADEKKKKLCIVYLAKAGFTINALISTVQTNSSTMLWSLATNLMPWNDTKSSDTDFAVTNCDAYAGVSGSGQTGFLLQTLSHLVRCATLLAKTDVVIGANGSATCATAGNGNGVLTDSDVQSGGFGMCDADAIQCKNDFASINTAAAGLNSDLQEIKNAVTTVDTAANLSSAANAAAARTALQTIIP